MRLYTMAPFYSPASKPIMHYDAPTGTDLDEMEFWMPGSVKVTKIKSDDEEEQSKLMRLTYPIRFQREEVEELFANPGNMFAFAGSTGTYYASIHHKPWRDDSNPDAKEINKAYVKFTPVDEDSQQDSDGPTETDQNILSFESFCKAWETEMNS